MLEKLKKLRNPSEFVRNSSTLAIGTILAQVLSIVAIPLTSRIYDPADYGVSGIYMSFSVIFGIISTLQYHATILLPKDESDAKGLLYVSILSGCGVSLLSVLLLVVGGKALAQSLNISESLHWLYLIPVSTFLGACNNAFSAYSNRIQKYKRISISRVVGGFCTIIITLLLGYLIEGPTGLILGLLTSQVVSTGMLVFQSWRFERHLFIQLPTKEHMKHLALRYKNFAIYTLPTEFVNNFINQIPVFFLSHYSSKSVVGHYNMGNRILGMPIQFVSSAIGEVFKQQASKDYATSGNCRPVFTKTLKMLLAFSIIPFGLIIWLAPDLFAFVLGEKWRQAGEYSRIMGVMFWVKFFVSPLTYMYHVAEKLQEDLIGHIYMVISTFAVLYIGYFQFHNVETTLLLYALNYVLIYVFYLFRSYHFTINRAFSHDS